MTTTVPARPLAPSTRLGPVHLTVTDLDRSVAFYRAAVGLVEHGRDGHVARLGAGGEELIVLVEEPDARPAGRHAGLYHVALLHPSRLELSRAARRLAATRTPIDGAADHHISEAIYLPDPDGIGLELAADRPKAAWPAHGNAIRPDPLDMAGLLAMTDGEPVAEAVDPGIAVGHVHIHVPDLEAGLAVYRDVIGFEEQVRMDSAAFISAGGYHHHLALNTWQGRGVSPLPHGVVGLRHWTLVLTPEDAGEVLTRADAAGLPTEPRADGTLVRDPFGMAVLIGRAPGSASL